MFRRKSELILPKVNSDTSLIKDCDSEISSIIFACNDFYLCPPKKC